MDTAVIIVGAGAGRRMGGRCKALIELEGKPLLCYSLEVFEKSSLVDGVVVAVPPKLLRYFEEEFASRWRYKKVFAWVAGGEHRQDSVIAAIKAVPDSVSLIAVHDVARPFITEQLLERLVRAARQAGAAVPGIEPVETVKEVDENGLVVKTLEREKLRTVRTPQFFSAHLIRRAYRDGKRIGPALTDDASLVERIGHEVVFVEGSRDNIKITWPDDLELAKHILRKFQKPSTKSQISFNDRMFNG